VKNTPWLTIHPDVEKTLAHNGPVVALESAVITHGLPRPANLHLAQDMENVIRTTGAVPATVAVLKGQVHLGLTADQLEELAYDESAVKVSRRDLGAVRAGRLSGGTTVAGTMLVAHAAGVRVFATGGIGGIHRGDGFDVSADLPELGQTPVAVVCAGAKSILDLPRTLERLETDGVPVMGWESDILPAFFSRDSGLKLEIRVNSADEAAAIVHAQWEMGLSNGALVCVPCPEEDALPFATIQALLQQAEEEADASGIKGKQITPFLLQRLADLSEGATLRANLALLRNNARVASQLAIRLAALS